MRGHVESGIEPRTRRERQVLDAVRGRVGFRLMRHGTRGAVRLEGPGVSLLVSDLAALSVDDLHSKPDR